MAAHSRNVTCPGSRTELNQPSVGNHTDMSRQIISCLGILESPAMSDIPALTESDAVSAPRYREIHDALRAKIVSGAWPPGFKLPSEPDLARSFDCARMTVGKALAALADKGFITRRRRAGTIVNAPRPQESILEIHDIEAEVRAAGHEYRYRCLVARRPHFGLDVVDLENR